MKPTDTIGDDVRLYRGDCLAVLPTLGTVDAVVVDIPYGEVNRESGGLRNLDKAEADVATFPLSSVVEQSSRLAKSVYVFCGIEQVSELRAGFLDCGMTTRLCVWEKTNPSPMNGEHFWLSSIEACVFARHSKAYFSENCASAVWRGPIAREPVHPTQKPTWLMRKIIRASVPKGGVVLDFCMGSGTAGVAAMREGCGFIGIELDPTHYATALRRLTHATGAGPGQLFAALEAS